MSQGHEVTNAARVGWLRSTVASNLYHLRLARRRLSPNERDRLMCGLFVSVGADVIDIAHVLRVLHHRGPDECGSVVASAGDGSLVTLCSTRLAIVDLTSAGHMPMSNERGMTLVYNGELYNTAELRDELRRRGHTFSSATDTEVVLRAYEEYGERCVEHLEGMFALALWDPTTDSLFIARDRFGIKPLYYAQDGRRFACASEVKALLTVPWITPSMSLPALSSYLTFLWVPDPLTMFDGILKLEAGHSATIRGSNVSVRQYWDVTFPAAGARFPTAEDDLVERFKGLFTAAVERQMVSDVPIGAFLSAGLDSSAIVAVMAQFSPDPVKTFTIGFPQASTKGTRTFDDVRVAERTARHFGCDHTSIEVEPDVVDLLPRLVWHMDEPVADPAAYHGVSRQQGSA